MSAHIVSPKIYLAVFASLIALTGVTVWVAGLDLGLLNTVVALGIAVSKATLVVLFFMHVKYGSRLTWVVMAGALLWLVILITGTLSDYYSPRFSPGSIPSVSRE